VEKRYPDSCSKLWQTSSGSIDSAARKRGRVGELICLDAAGAEDVSKWIGIGVGVCLVKDAIEEGLLGIGNRIITAYDFLFVHLLRPLLLAQQTPEIPLSQCQVPFPMEQPWPLAQT
jgi:hypothetical protein